MTYRRALDSLLFPAVITLCFAGCAPTSENDISSNASRDASVDAPMVVPCPEDLDGDTLRLTAFAQIEPGQDVSYCRRYTTSEPLAITQFVGTLGPAGHHALLLVRPSSTEPDGLGPCSEAEIMDSSAGYPFQLLGGVSYETDGVPVVFPSSPVQVGLLVPAGAQLVFDAHFLNPGTKPVDTCASMSFSRGSKIDIALQFRTVLPKSEYGLTIPAHQTVDVSYDDEPMTSRYRILAASSHMHEGGKHFRMSIVETGQTLYETTTWVEPKPTLYDKTTLVIEQGQTIRIECSLENTTATGQKFPEQMCVGGMYVMPW